MVMIHLDPLAKDKENVKFLAADMILTSHVRYRIISSRICTSILMEQ